MRSYLNAVAALIACAALVGATAPAVDASVSAPCGDTGMITFPAASVLWPPDHKYHPYPITYSGGAPGDVLTVSATSSDGIGAPSGQGVSSVMPGATGTAAAIGLLAERSPAGVARTYIVTFFVSGSNACGGMALATMQHDARPTS